MKPQIIVFCTILLCMVACLTPRSDTSNGLIASPSDDLAIEIISEYTLTTYNRLLDVENDSDFIDESLRGILAKSPRYNNQLLPKTKGENDMVNDTLSMSEEIPFCADFYETTLIYRDGQAELSQEVDLNSEINPLLGFHSYPIDLSSDVTKLEVKDGVARAYNMAGELLYEMEMEMPDYSDYLEELSNGVSEDMGTKAEKKDINWLRRKMDEAYPDSKSLGTDMYRLYTKDNGIVVLEQDVAPTKAGESVMIRTFFSPDIELNYGYEQLVGGILRIRCTNTYEESTPKTKGIFYEDSISDRLPSKSVTESISQMWDGTPTISVEEKEFRQNKTVIHL